MSEVTGSSEKVELSKEDNLTAMNAEREAKEAKEGANKNTPEEQKKLIQH